MPTVVAAKATQSPTPGRDATGAPSEPAGEAGTDPARWAGPAGADLIAALLLWPELDERCFRLVARCLGQANLIPGEAAEEPGQPDWESFRSALLRDGWIEAGATPGVYRVTASHRPTLEEAITRLGGPAAIEAALVAGQSSTADARLLEELALSAEATRAWQVLELFWITLSEAGIPLTPATLRVVRDVPMEARKAHPILTWASGAAASMLAQTPYEHDNALMDRLLFDSALLHGDWSLHEDTDTAVLAGTFRLIGQRRMPGTGTTRGLDASWATKQEVDAFIERRTAEGRGPSRIPHSVFRAFSARVAVLRAQFPEAIQEAHLAQLLSEWQPVTALARGVEALARAIAFDVPVPSDAHGPSGPPTELGMLGLSGIGAAFGTLADGFNALSRLDREGVNLALSRLPLHGAEVAGVWAVRTALVALRDAVWGNPSEGLNRLLAEFANRSPMMNEQDEPLGRSVLGRARILLLTKSGALAAAQQAVEEMPRAARPVPAARTALWAGHAADAVRLAEDGLLRTGLLQADRARLIVVSAVASLSQGTATPAVQEKAVRAMDDLVAGHIWWPIAALPAAGRDTLLQLYREHHGVDDLTLQRLLDRLAELNDAESANSAVRLTQRELQLLPLLATDDAIPAIARDLHVSVHTVRTQVATLREKFDVGTRSELVRQAALLGVIPAQRPEAGSSGGALAW